MFKVGDKVRRKKDWQGMNGWSHGSDLMTVHGLDNYGQMRFDGITTAWDIKGFDLVESAKPSEGKPMGPIERLLTQDIHSGTHTCKAIRDVIDSGLEYDNTGRRIVLDVIDQAIAAEREAMGKTDSSMLTDREQYAIHQHDITCEHLAIGKSPDDDGDTLLEAVSEIYDRMVKANKRAEAAEELNRKWQADYASLSEETAAAKAALDNERQFFAVNQHAIEAQKAEIDTLTQSCGKAAMLEREVARLESENERLRSAIAAAAKNDVPRAAIECILNTLCGVLLANGMRPRDHRPIHDVSLWLDELRKVQS